MKSFAARIDAAPPWLRRAGYWGATLARDVRSFMTVEPAKAAPSEINIEPSNLCNADCVFCGYQYQTRPHEPVKADLASEVIDAARAASVKRLGLTPTVGEPLVNRNLEAIIRYAKRPPSPLEVGLTTNALLLNPDRYLSLVAAGLDSLDISMTYPDEAEYLRVYRNPGLKTLVRNLEGVLRVYQREQCQVCISVRTARPVWDHPLFDSARAAGWNVARNSFFDDWSGSVSEGLREHGFMRRPLRGRRLPCTMLFSGPHVLSDGRATACGCRDLDGKSELVLDTASLLRDLSGSYNGGAIEVLRQRFRDGDPPDVCVTCRHYTPQFAGQPMRVRAQQLMADLLAAVRDDSRD